MSSIITPSTIFSTIKRGKRASPNLQLVMIPWLRTRRMVEVYL